MSVDKFLERLATASERQADALEGLLQLQLSQGNPQPVEAEVREPTYAEQRKAEVKAEAAAAKAPDPEPAKKRGRPAGSKNAAKEEVKPEVVEPEVEEDPFAEPSEPEAEEEVNLETVRKALVDMRKFVVSKHGEQKGKELAYSLLRDAGKGASYLPGATGAGPAGGPGELKPANYAAVVKAAKAVINAG